MKKIKLLLLLLCNISLYGQHRLLKKNIVFANEVNAKDSEFTIYPQDFKIVGVYKSESEFKAKYPEEVFVSMLSANTPEWYQRNYEYPVMNKFKKIDSLNDTKLQTKITLLVKFAFVAAENHYSIIKFKIESNQAETSSVICFVLKNQRWIATNDISLGKLMMAFDFLSITALKSIFLNIDSGVKEFEKSKQAFYKEGILNLNAYMASSTTPNLTLEEKEILIDPYKLSLIKK